MLIANDVGGAALKSVGQFFKYGHTRLRFHGFPFHPGGKVDVTFSPNRCDDLKVTLRFVEERMETTACGENRTTRVVSYTHHSEEHLIETRRTRAEVDLVFDLPDNPEWTNRLPYLQTLVNCVKVSPRPVSRKPMLDTRTMPVTVLAIRSAQVTGVPL